MTTEPSAERYLDAEAIAAELGVHLQTVQRYFREGGLPGRKIGKSWRTTREALDTWIAGGNATIPGDIHVTLTQPSGGALPPLETKDQP